MTAPVFLVPSQDVVAEGGVLLVAGPEGRHAVTVRRLAVGEPVDCVDGAGWRGTGVVTGVRPPDRLEVRIERSWVEPVPSPRLIVVQALPKGERGEVAVETLTEVGVDVVVPWAAARCVARWRGDRADRGAARWRRAALAAAKQARRARVPDVLDLADTADVVTLLGTATRALVLDEGAALRLATMAVPTSGDVVLVVGPEGGLTEDERTAFAAAGGLAVRMGASVLRTSTAGTAAAAVVLAASGRWS